MAQDPAATTGPVSDDATADNALLLNKKNKYRDVQKVDARLREAVAAGDENYVRSRLGGDRVLSEAEILLLIKTRQEAEQNIGLQIAQQQAVEQLGRAENRQQEETFQQWAQRYVAARADQAKQQAGRSSYLDAQGRDPDGHKYFDNFGYDRQGNYNDSFGGRMRTDGIYEHPQGAEVDIRRGVVTQGQTAYNHHTGDVILFDADLGGYVQMHATTPGGRMEPVKGQDGNILIMTQQQRDEQLAEWRRTNPTMTPAEYAEAEASMRRIDQDRRAHVAASSERTADSTSSAEAGGHGEVATPAGRASSGRASSGRDSSGTAVPLGMAIGDAAIGQVSRATRDLDAYKLERNLSTQNRGSTWNSQFQRIDERRRSTASGGGEREAADQVDAAERARLEARVSRFRAGNVPVFTKGEASRVDSAISTKWVKDTKNGGIWDDKGGYYDTQGGYWDKQGGYLDSKGNYADQYGGFKSADGSYTDSKGNYVDPDGNLWLAGNTGNTPDFPKKAGVNYIDVLAKAAENRYDELAKGNAGMTAEEARELQTRLTAIDAEFKITKIQKDAGPRNENPAPEAAVTASAKSSFIITPAASSAEPETEKEASAVSLKRPAVAGPRTTG